MSEKKDLLDIHELGKHPFEQLIGVLQEREDNKYPSAGWGGKSGDLKDPVEKNKLCPAAAFAIVADGLSNIESSGPQLKEDAESLRILSDILRHGADIFNSASQIDKDGLMEQIRKYIEKQEGKFFEKTDWEELIKLQSAKLQNEAHAFDETRG